jgi:hypothetical protein
MNFRLRISGSQLENSDDTAWWKYSFFFENLKYSLRWQFANLVADMVTSQSPISGNRKYWCHNIGRHQCCPGDVLLQEKDCRKLLSSWTIAVCRGYHLIPSMELEMVRFYVRIKILLELPSFL